MADTNSHANGIRITSETMTMTVVIPRRELVEFVAQNINRTPGELGTFEATSDGEGGLLLTGSWVGTGR